MALFKVQDLSCLKRDRLLFAQISFVLNEAELLYIKGPNGAGKTSLLRILVGLAEAETGEVLFQGQNIRQCREFFLQKLVYFGHKLGLNAQLSALENVTFWCRQHGEGIDDASLYDLLGQLGLVGLENLPVGHLSAGQQRRVALTRLWLKKAASLWVLDEPFTALDKEAIAMVEEKLNQHLSSGGSVILTSHQDVQLTYPSKVLSLEYRL